MLAIKSFAIDLIIILCSFVCHIEAVSFYDVANPQTNTTRTQQQQQVTTGANNDTSQQQQQLESITNFYTNSQALKFRVNVSNICEKKHMRVTIRLSRPFYGLIHTKDRRKKAACQVEGTGEQTYIMEISYTLVQSDPNYCGIVSHQVSMQATANQSIAAGATLSVALVVRLHKTIEFSDDRYFLLSCANRCQRFDCSPDPDSNNQLRLGGSQQIGFTASESILAPVLRASDLPQVAGSGPSKFAESPGWTTTERCDHLLDLKFQWLAKICWALLILLAAMFCTSYCLCLALNRRNKSKRNKQPGNTNRRATSSHLLGKPTNPIKGITYATQSSLNLSSDGNPIVSSWPSNMQISEDELSKIRDNNAYLGHQRHQELILADLMTKSGQSLDVKPQQQTDQGQIMILGRSAGAYNTLSGPKQYEAPGMRIKRRRSIGSSAAVGALAQESERNLQQVPKWQRAGKLDASQRAKSRSQTTIHYEQGQDPFKTVPFSYMNNGYISDGAASQRVYLDSGSAVMDAYGVAPSNQQVGVNLQQTAISSPGGHLAPLSSQFDPQNSRQLVNLIQHKHMQQMAQAGQTAAFMQQRQPPAVEGRAWRR